MLFEIGNAILIDGVPVLKNLACNIQKADKLIRLKTDVFKKDIKQVSMINIDLALKYHKLKFGFTQVSIQIDGRELLRNVYFTVDLIYKYTSRKWHVTGKIGNNAIDQDLASLAEVLKIIAENV
jgi:hypothetical protein